VARRCVWSRNLENEEAKARYRAVENTTTMGCNAKKTNNKQYSVNIYQLRYSNMAIHAICYTENRLINER
jgi:hypothetical protein